MGDKSGEPSTHVGADARAAVGSLLTLHGGRLHALALRLCGHRADAEDLVQETFLQAWRKWPSFRGESDPGTWLYAIAGRLCKARLRRKGGIDRRIPAMSQLMPWRETAVMEAAAAPAGLEDEAEKREARARVQGAIIKLPEHLRGALVMKDVLGLSVQDAAAALGLAENTVKTRVHRARLALRKAMTAGGSSVPAPAPVFDRQVCIDLLKAKMEAMDDGGVTKGFRVPQADLCARCRAVFRELDFVQDACVHLASGTLPPGLKRAILAEIARRDQGDGAARGKGGPRRGRRPVASSSAPR